MKAIDLRPGYGVKMDGKLWVVAAYEFRNPGNLRSFVNIKFKNVQTGGQVEKRCQPSEDVEIVDLDRRPMEYLFSDGHGATFMDNETYDQLVMPKDVLGDALLYLRPNAQTVVLCYNGNPISIELPLTVELEIKDTPPEVKGATATNQLKDAELETGLKTRVPAFIKIGETIKVSTTDGSYIGRAKE
ncbi:MAG TPA: elongation factor P [Phycisphaerales bacterium]|jgi:elongation factor P|nr:elongation factor P [Phycisphaerales bacterium]